MSQNYYFIATKLVTKCPYFKVKGLFLLYMVTPCHVYPNTDARCLYWARYYIKVFQGFPQSWWNLDGHAYDIIKEDQLTGVTGKQDKLIAFTNNQLAEHHQ